MASFQVAPVTFKEDVHPQYVEMKVPLYSYGCEKKVKKALAHLKGIHSVHVDYDLQKVTVWGICNRDAVLAIVKKKRREARFWDQVDGRIMLQVASAEDGEKENAGDEAASPEAPERVPSERGGFKMRKPWRTLLPSSLALR